MLGNYLTNANHNQQKHKMIKSKSFNRILIISIAMLNLLLIVDYLILGILKCHIPLLQSFSNYWFQLEFWDSGYHDFTYFYIDIILKLTLLLQVIYFIITDKHNLYSQLLIIITLIVYGLSFIYQYIFWDFIGFHWSVFVKFVLLTLFISLCQNYFKKPFDIMLSKKTSLILTIVFFLPFFIFETFHIIGKERVSNDQIIESLQAIVDSRIKQDSSDKIIVNQTPLLNSRRTLFNNFKNHECSLFDKIYMYAQINTDKVQNWNGELTHMVTIPYNRYSNEQMDSLSKICKTSYVVGFSKPIFNFDNSLAYVSVFSIFIPEPTGRYFKQDNLILEKTNKLWRLKNK